MNKRVRSTYLSWRAMHSRCYNHKDDSFKYYGAKGITVDPEWSDFNVFLHDMGEVPDGHTLDRKFVDLGYSKDNCRWATPTEQARNKTNTRWVTHKGETLSITTWAERSGLPVNTVKSRLDAGWPVERALSTPPQVQRRSKDSVTPTVTA